MNREIKFRVWLNNQFVHLGDVQRKKGEPTNLRFTTDYDVIWQQFTGLKDKNGKEIYEGDILISDEEVGTFEVKWDKESAAFLVGEDLWPNANLLVIGNIFENPELIA